MLEIHPVTRERWNDLVALFATSPVTSACWCMWPRVPMGEMHTRTPEQNQRDLRALVEVGAAPGLLASVDGEPVGWCSVGRRSDFGRFSSKEDDDSVWLIACVFARASHRGRGVTAALLEGAVGYAAEHGAVAVEGPPRGWRPDDQPGSLDRVLMMFRKAGFRDVADPEGVATMRKDV